ncbi:HEAT repeat domain-containing protein [Myxococcota bacterium]|nr:HEAT repeat domain-containing protein [Myxococcota bacterium]MBU1535488.1 HEAT repeat domain-containing protein [Myxococcota bacterium]
MRLVFSSLMILLLLSPGCKDQSRETPKKAAVPALKKKFPLPNLPKSAFIRKKISQLDVEDYTKIPLNSVLKDLKKARGHEIERAQKVFMAQPEKAVPLLVSLLDNSDNLTRIHAVRLLGDLMPHSKHSLPAVLKRLHEEKITKILSMVIDSLRKMAPHSPALERDLLALLSSPSPLVVWQAAKSLGVFGKKATKSIEGLKKLLTAKENYIRLTAATSLWQISGNLEGFMAIKKDMEDPDRNFRKLFITTLSKLPPEPLVMEFYIRALNDKAIPLRRMAALALKKLGPKAKKTLDTLREAAKHKDYSLRKYSLEAIAAIEKSN